MKENLAMTYECFMNPVLFAPVEKGDIVGNAVYYNGDKVILKVPIVSQDDVDGLPEIVKTKEESLFKRFKKWLFNR